MTTKEPRLVVDDKGLAKLVERRGKHWILGELWQNAVDEDVTEVHMTLELLEKSGYAQVAVEDDSPEGFRNLAHAYTLFAESDKKDDPTKRGRFNLGEKLVIAMCKEARIATTKGTIRFEEDGRIMEGPIRKRGSKFEGVVPMSPAEFGEACAFVMTLFPPEGVKVTFNGMEVPHRQPVTEFQVPLRTERADAHGVLRPTQRKTTVRVIPALETETACLYEMGIPVVETGDKWHVDIGQKVPLNSDRDNVPPFYLRDVRTAVLNYTADLLDPEDAKAAWVTSAMEDENADPDALAHVVKGRFGEKAVIADPTDPEANKIAAEQGYTVVPGGALPKAAWKNIKQGAGQVGLLPAGQVTPSPNPEEGDEVLKLMAADHYPPGIANIVEFSKEFARELLDAEIDVRVANSPQWPFAATYGPRRGRSRGLLTLNLGRLGFRWFEEGPSERVVDLLIHELAHHIEKDHLDRRYIGALSALGAKAVRLALERPGLYTAYAPKAVAA